tara:strand:- start:13618 stop:14250 length:633 start_codon:yes stop_codon:yes gene_type:complete
MAITFPRDLIEPFRVRSCTFEQMEIQARSPARGGQVQVVGLGPAVWSMKYETVPLTEAQGAAWEAWLSSLRGGARLFKAWHPYRRYGLAYPRGGPAAFSGACTLASVGGGLDTVTLSGLPSNYVLSPGDLMSWEHAANSQALHRVVEGATASTGGGATVTVEPTVRPSPGSTAVTLHKAWCHAVVDPSSIEVRWSPGRRAVVSFAGMQTL